MKGLNMYNWFTSNIEGISVLENTISFKISQKSKIFTLLNLIKWLLIFYELKYKDWIRTADLKNLKTNIEAILGGKNRVFIEKIAEIYKSVKRRCHDLGFFFFFTNLMDTSNMHNSWHVFVHIKVAGWKPM